MTSMGLPVVADMAHDTFISYSKRDKATADAVCHALEADGIRCWIAPRDLRAGLTWKQGLVEAIRETRMMVLIFSSQANSSAQVQREVDIAFESKHPILPFRIEDVEMNDDLYYCVAARHWLDALTDPKDEQIKELVASVRALVGTQSQPSATPTPPTVDGGLLAGRLGGRAVRRMTIGAVVIAIALMGRVLFPALFPAPSVAELAGRGVAAYNAEDYATALPFLVEAAEKDDPEAQFTLGSMYLNTYGVAKDVDRALALFQASADQGFAGAQTNLGYMYQHGLGVETDAEEAVRLYQLAAEQGDTIAEVNLVRMDSSKGGEAPDDSVRPVDTPPVDTPDDGMAAAAPGNGLLVMVYGEGPGPLLVEGFILRSLRTRREVRLMDANSLAIIRRDETAVRSASQGDFLSLADLGRQHGAEFMIVGDLESSATRAAGPMFSGSAQLNLRMYRVSSGEVVNSAVFRVGMGGEPARAGRTAADARSQAAEEVGKQGAGAARGWLVRALRN